MPAYRERLEKAFEQVANEFSDRTFNLRGFEHKRDERVCLNPRASHYARKYLKLEQHYCHIAFNGGRYVYPKELIKRVSEISDVQYNRIVSDYYREF